MATTDKLWVMDGELEDQLNNIRGRLNGSGSELGLFTTNSTPTPADVVADYTVPTQTGYAAVSLTARWTAAARDEAGVWSMQTEVFTFSTTSVSPQNVYGVWIKIGTDVICAGLLDAPFAWAQATPLRVRVVYVQYAALTFKAIVLS